MVVGNCNYLCQSVLFRRKTIDLSTVTETKLARVLTTLDLTALGIGSTLGIGIYVIAGQVARELAGPSVILSFLIAAVASVFAGLCYAEFGARVPKTGSAYVYSYITVGELVAFVIGWNLILEYVIGTASVARGWTAYLDSLINYRIENFWKEHMTMNISFLGHYPDFFAMGLVFALTVVLAIGVKESSVVNNVFTFVNLFVVVYVIICGCFKINFHNWKIPLSEVPNKNGTEPFGTGGFFPYGFSGTLSGAATCFYAFVGFDCIATTGEEVKNPQKAIPISIILCLLACFLAYFGISAVLTLMLPYYVLDWNAPLTVTFGEVGYIVAKYVIAVGALSGLSASLLGAMFPMPRIVYAMAEDGLLFRWLAVISERFKTPFIATIVSGVFAGIMALLFNLQDLVEMMSIGTLLAYTLVAVCILILRYDVSSQIPAERVSTYGAIQSQLDTGIPQRHIMIELFKPNKTQPDKLSQGITKVSVIILGVMIAWFSTMLIFFMDELGRHVWWALLLSCLPAVNIVVIMIILYVQPQNKVEISFKVPFVPLIPALSIFVNIYLMLKLRYITWIRFAIWMAIGFIIYFSYGIWKSSERNTDPETEPLFDEDNTQYTPSHNAVASSTVAHGDIRNDTEYTDTNEKSLIIP